MGLKLHRKYCSFMPALITAFNNTEGDILEMGAGPSSTFLLSWLCQEYDRKLVTYENYTRFYDMVKHCEHEYHEVHFVMDWDDADIERPWGVAFIDHAPAIRRKDDIKKLVNYAQCLVVHDTQGRANKHYRYDEVLPLFKYIKGYPKLLPQTLILSNFRDVSRWR